ncbi:hypothetical protein U1872_07305 [Sphingomonas sp. RB3P16]|uniref:hypothetical protein n=1 Tax=Parasphingomonas frigoris TaxID=3096163 RepID=UPI002FC59CAC
MVSGLVSVAAALCGVGLILAMVIRSRQLPPLARYAVIGSSFGLFLSSRYMEVDHSFGAIIFTIGVAALMMTVAIRHLRAFPPAY